MIDVIKKLAAVADSLDEKGLFKESDFLDEIISKISKKTKLDPVGQEDEDIDNDGKVTKSDKYLAKRRHAIKKSKSKPKKSK